MKMSPANKNNDNLLQNALIQILTSEFCKSNNNLFAVCFGVFGLVGPLMGIFILEICSYLQKIYALSTIKHQLDNIYLFLYCITAYLWPFFIGVPYKSGPIPPVVCTILNVSLFWIFGFLIAIIPKSKNVKHFAWKKYIGFCCFYYFSYVLLLYGWELPIERFPAMVITLIALALPFKLITITAQLRDSYSASNSASPGGGDKGEAGA